MSHKVTIEAIKRNSIYHDVEKLLNDYQSIMATLYNANLKAIFEPKIKQLEQILTKLEATVNQEYNHEITRIWSALQHDFTVLAQFNQPLINAIQNQNLDLNKAITKWKNLAVIALEMLSTTKSPINDVTLAKQISKIQDQIIPQALVKQAKQQINRAKLDQVIKTYLKTKVANSTYRDYGDLAVTIANWENLQAKTDQMLKDVISTLTELDFKIASQSTIKKGLDSYHNFAYALKMVDPQTNHLVELVINSKQELFYQLGNYQGHLCEDATKQLKAILIQKYDYQILNERISRDYPDRDQQQVVFIKQTKTQTY